MEPTKQDAEAMLAEAGGIQLAVRARTPREHVPSWRGVSSWRSSGRSVISATTASWEGSSCGSPRRSASAILVDYLRRCRQVRVTPRTPSWLALAFAAWVVAAATLLPGLVDGTISFAYTLGGVLAAAPLLWWAERLRRNA